jgi:hypothetical protein
MAVRDFELYHGIALTKIVRNDRPTALRLIETKPSESWSVYRVNDAVNLYVKSSATPSPLKRKKNSLVWTFVFGTSHLQELQKLRQEKDVYVALICARRKIGSGPMEVCLIGPDDLVKCIDIESSKQQTIRVMYQPGMSLRAYGPLNSTKRNRLKIHRNALDEWRIPGS